jgi:undecaprenyl-diphosphatase
MKKKIILLVSLLSLFSFTVLSKYEDRASMRDLDFAVTTKVQDKVDSSAHLRAAALVDNAMEGATFFASPEFTVVLTLLFWGLLAYDRQKKSWNWKAIWFPIALIAIVALEVFGKSIVHHPSPPFSMIKHTTSVFPANYVNEQYSYPSGHAARALFLGVGVLLVLRKKRLFKTPVSFWVAVAGVVGYILLVSVSRVYLGHHWFSDVVGGLLVGASFSLAALALLW